ncbi:hypothetical protein K2X33_07195, partial [bacterium]|nr:hypothetical protein [bacterium]
MKWRVTIGRRVRETSTRVFAWLSRTFEGRVPQGQLGPSDSDSLRRWPLFAFTTLFCFAVTAVLIAPDPRAARLPTLRVGELAEQTITSPLTVELEPHSASKGRERSTPPVFD